MVRWEEFNKGGKLVEKCKMGDDRDEGINFRKAEDIRPLLRGNVQQEDVGWWCKE